MSLVGFAMKKQAELGPAWMGPAHRCASGFSNLSQTTERLTQVPRIPYSMLIIIQQEEEHFYKFKSRVEADRT